MNLFLCVHLFRSESLHVPWWLTRAKSVPESVDLQVLIKIMQIIDIYLILFSAVENNVYQRPVRKPTLKWRIHW